MSSTRFERSYDQNSEVRMSMLHLAFAHATDATNEKCKSEGYGELTILEVAEVCAKRSAEFIRARRKAK